MLYFVKWQFHMLIFHLDMDKVLLNFHLIFLKSF